MRPERGDAVLDATLDGLQHRRNDGLGLRLPLAILIVEVPAVMEALKSLLPECCTGLVAGGFELGWRH